jgi:predicted N-acetyltransferase YhbS
MTQAQEEALDTAAVQLSIRAAAPGDADECGQIFYEAFESIARRHNLPVEPDSRAFTRFLVGVMLASPGCAGLVAERAGTVVGSAFVDERGSVAGIGPVTVDPDAQDDGVGRKLMEALLEREHERGVPGIRLIQTAYHYRSLALYAKLGFAAREPLTVFQGTPPALGIPGLGTREARREDLGACADLCVRVHGHDRTGELEDAIAFGTAMVVERPGGITGYATGFGYGFHAVAEANRDLTALLGSADGYRGLGILVPTRNAELVRWCLASGLRIVQQSTLMTAGLYNEPAGAWLPSIVY